MRRKHHYVPKFLLRQFSIDKKRIDVFQIKPKKLRKNVGLSDQCYEKFYYGKDGEIEDAFSKLEGPASEVIRSICSGNFKGLSDDSFMFLREFIVYQNARTKAAADEANRFMEAASKEVIRKSVEIEGVPEGIPENFLDMINIKFGDSKYVSLSAAGHSMPAVYDLNMKILMSKGKHEFILSDNPVIRCNQFAEFHPHFSKINTGTRGFAQKGIQIFMPISPLICLAMYDSTTYEYGSAKSAGVFIGDRDVKLLNHLQAFSADRCLYQSISGPGYEQLCEYADFRKKHNKSKKPRIERSVEMKQPDGKMSQLIFTSGEQFPTEKKFSFSRVIDNNDYKNLRLLPARSKELVENLRKYRSEVKKLIKE